MQSTSARRRSFLQSIICLLGGAASASAAQEKAAPSSAANPSLKFRLHCRHQHAAGQSTGRLVCNGQLTQEKDAAPVGEFYSNCFYQESLFGVSNAFAASNIELHTIRFADGTIFGMGANNSRSASERVHAILGGTGRFAGARGTYVISGDAPESATELTISLLT